MSEEKKPSVSDQKVPLWIKVMWFIGILWIIAYVIDGLLSPPFS